MLPTHDCCSFAADCVLAMTGVDKMAGYRGGYKSAVGASRKLAKAGGMVQEGVNRASFFRGGSMVDQIEFGITKQEWETCQQQSL